jgi:hypothetical protein
MCVACAIIERAAQRGYALHRPSRVYHCGAALQIISGNASPDAVDNMVTLGDLNEASLLHNLRQVKGWRGGGREKEGGR